MSEHNAVKEAKKLGIPVAAILDTNCDPDDADIPIPGNDDAVKAINLFCQTMANAIIEGREGRDFQSADQIPEIQAKAAEPEVDMSKLAEKAETKADAPSAPPAPPVEAAPAAPAPVDPVQPAPPAADPAPPTPPATPAAE